MNPTGGHQKLLAGSVRIYAVARGEATTSGEPSPPLHARLHGQERSAAQMDEILVYCRQFYIVHLSNRLPRHLLAEFMSGGIDPGTHGRNELPRLPILYKIQAGTDRSQLPLNSTYQIGAVAFAAILVGQDISRWFQFRVPEQHSVYTTGFEWRESTRWRSHEPTAHPIR